MVEKTHLDPSTAKKTWTACLWMLIPVFQSPVHSKKSSLFSPLGPANIIMGSQVRVTAEAGFFIQSHICYCLCTSLKDLSLLRASRTTLRILATQIPQTEYMVTKIKVRTKPLPILITETVLELADTISVCQCINATICANGNHWYAGGQSQQFARIEHSNSI